MKKLFVLMAIGLFSVNSICVAQNSNKKQDPSKEVCHPDNYNNTNAAQRAANSCYSKNGGVLSGLDRVANEAQKQAEKADRQASNKTESAAKQNTNAKADNKTPQSPKTVSNQKTNENKQTQRDDPKQQNACKDCDTKAGDLLKKYK